MKIPKHTSPLFYLTETVIGDSTEDTAYMDNHLNRPEILIALSNSYGLVKRFSKSLQKDMVFGRSESGQP